MRETRLATDNVLDWMSLLVLAGFIAHSAYGLCLEAQSYWLVLSRMTPPSVFALP